MCHNITKSLDSGKAVIGIFIDLSKAFDTLNHNILLDKLNYLDIHNVALQWFKSNLASRTQYVNLDNINFTKKLITCGLSQCLILGPLLFLSYILMICLIVPNYYILYCFLSDNNLNNLIEIVNNGLVHLCNWFRANKFSFNISKTNFIIFGNKCDTYRSNPINCT